MKDSFRKVANKISNAAGSAWAFCLAITVIAVWAITGPIFDYSNTWQLIINTGTTIITFLMVFLIQNTQNRDAKAMQIKLDELIRATRANDSYIDIEDLSDDELALLYEKFKRIRDDDGNNPALHKFNKKLDDVLNKRRQLPGEKMAAEMANKLNPFAEHENHKK